MTATLAKILLSDSGVNEAYRHGPKTIVAGNSVEIDGAVLKWYRLHPEDQPVPEQIDQLARSFLDRTALEAKGLGFVILHRCGNDFYFLIVTTWRGNNEVWETVYYKDGERMSDFELWPRDAAHKPTFCAWELAAVWHEKQAWERFLRSDRDDSAAEAWHRDLYSGAA
ncbi:MAG: hypothetical protein ACJ8M1_14235 [Chthoniobacterales bacterium]